ncbi:MULTISPECIES: hypothetical protein [Bacillus]|uniref:Uncharacterized protein n=2 Tax=Bacillus TaxID=1386 RepID=A0A0M4FS25_9BACI|nr:MULTISPECIES: hypothetical protein [Bacillus]ALC80693.1 hypothetical protein AM592_03140 [Bacillus gobiensis]MBP1079585.1 hypothetical protein [Bacillus capparidis]MED1094986.1 hypothetical protein [Bacillus capparidis]
MNGMFYGSIVMTAQMKERSPENVTNRALYIKEIIKSHLKRTLIKQNSCQAGSYFVRSKNLNP